MSVKAGRSSKGAMGEILVRGATGETLTVDD